MHSHVSAAREPLCRIFHLQSAQLAEKSRGQLFTRVLYAKKIKIQKTGGGETQPEHSTALC